MLQHVNKAQRLMVIRSRSTHCVCVCVCVMLNPVCVCVCACVCVCLCVCVCVCVCVVLLASLLASLSCQNERRPHTHRGCPHNNGKNKKEFLRPHDKK